MSQEQRQQRASVMAPVVVPAWVYVVVVLALVVSALAFGYVLLDSPV